MNDDDWAYNTDEAQFDQDYNNYLDEDDGLNDYLDDYIPSKDNPEDEE